jgi:hypothetical protein
MIYQLLLLEVLRRTLVRDNWLAIWLRPRCKIRERWVERVATEETEDPLCEGRSWLARSMEGMEDECVRCRRCAGTKRPDVAAYQGEMMSLLSMLVLVPLMWWMILRKSQLARLKRRLLTFRLVQLDHPFVLTSSSWHPHLTQQRCIHHTQYTSLPLFPISLAIPRLAAPSPAPRKVKLAVESALTNRATRAMACISDRYCLFPIHKNSLYGPISSSALWKPE